MASISPPVKASSTARLRPTWRATATIGVWQNRPPLPPGVENPAASLATMRSQLAANWAPAAVARPWTWATTTWGTSDSAVMAEVQVSNSTRSSSSSMRAISARSWPAENTEPVAASTIPATSSCPPVERRAWSSSRRTSVDRQLRRCAPSSSLTRVSHPGPRRAPPGATCPRYRALGSLGGGSKLHPCRSRAVADRTDFREMAVSFPRTNGRRVWCSPRRHPACPNRGWTRGRHRRPAEPPVTEPLLSDGRPRDPEELVRERLVAVNRPAGPLPGVR